MQRSAQLLQNKTSNDAEIALGVIDEALFISSYSEKLLEMKAEALFMVCFTVFWGLMLLRVQEIVVDSESSMPIGIYYCVRVEVYLS